MKKKDDEENFDEAVAQVYKVYQKTKVGYYAHCCPERD